MAVVRNGKVMHTEHMCGVHGSKRRYSVRLQLQRPSSPNVGRRSPARQLKRCLLVLSKCDVQRTASGNPKQSEAGLSGGGGCLGGRRGRLGADGTFCEARTIDGTSARLCKNSAHKCNSSNQKRVCTEYNPTKSGKIRRNEKRESINALCSHVRWLLPPFSLFLPPPFLQNVFPRTLHPLLSVLGNAP